MDESIDGLSGKNSILQDPASYIKVDLKHVQILPTNEFIISTREDKLAFLFRYTSHLISISLNNMEYEITIPLNQIIVMKITKDQEIAIELKRNFKKSVTERNGNSPIITICSDPTNGKLNDAVYILFKPMHWVENNTLLMVEAGMQRLRFNLARGTDDGFSGSNSRVKQDVLISSSGSLADSQTQPPISQPRAMEMEDLLLSFTESEPEILYSNVNSISTVNDNEVTEFYITCVFLTERRAVLFSQEGSFNQFIEHVQQRFGSSSFNNIYYKNKVDEMISLKDEEDWDVAKWEAEMEGTIRLNIYMG
ncbi:hypothetical protein C2G38_2189040 [Gigaspora rosea]|uniref:Uncharacterized protein n=1 Tax=Gigaspora rosea TaxID=44941 RepID=A0A397V2X2_9GLOM|nr:hypothetical protein C2G38_2189040 [Gigaspora rosea]